MYLYHVHILYKPYSASAIESIGDFNAWKEGDCTVTKYRIQGEYIQGKTSKKVITTQNT